MKHNIILFLATFITVAVFAQAPKRSELTGPELSNINEGVQQHQFLSKEYFTLADLKIVKTGKEPNLYPYEDLGIWIGKSNDKIDSCDIEFIFSKPILEVQFLFAHINNDVHGTEELALISVRQFDRNLPFDSIHTSLVTGKDCGIPTSMQGLINWNANKKILSGNPGSCCESGSGRLTVKCSGMTSLVIRHREKGRSTSANGVVLMGISFITPSSKKPITTIAPKVVVNLPKVNPVYFDYDRAVINQEAQAGLEKVVEYYKIKPQTKFEILSYTDCRGNETYNLRLSEMRAEQTIKYLIERGIPSENLTFKGMGLIYDNKCNCNDPSYVCSDEDYRNFRKTEVLISD